MNNQNLGGIVVAVIAMGVVGFLGYSWYQKNEQDKAMAQAVAPFNSLVKDYKDLPKPPKGDVKSGKKVKPKMITIDVKKASVDWTYFKLPPEMRAATPEEVESVVWLFWDNERVAEYQGGGWALRHTCTITVYDWKTKKLVAQGTVAGSEPPQSTDTPAGSNDYGDKPDDKIIFYLRNVVGL